MEKYTVQDGLEQLKASTSQLLQKIKSCEANDFNTSAGEGKWSLAQVGEHLRKSYKGMWKLMIGPAKVSDRDPVEKIDLIQNSMADFSIKMVAPEFVVPPVRQYEKAAVVESLQEMIRNLIEAVHSLDPFETCTSFAFPVYGEVTRLEIIYFCAFHTGRHVHQLKQNVNLKKLER